MELEEEAGEQAPFNTMTANEESEAQRQEIEKEILFDLIKSSDDPNLAEAMKDPLLIAKLLYSEELAKKIQEKILRVDQARLMIEMEKIKIDVQIQRIFDEQKADLPKTDDGCKGSSV